MSGGNNDFISTLASALEKPGASGGNDSGVAQARDIIKERTFDAMSPDAQAKYREGIERKQFPLPVTESDIGNAADFDEMDFTTVRDFLDKQSGTPMFFSYVRSKVEGSERQTYLNAHISDAERHLEDYVQANAREKEAIIEATPVPQLDSITQAALTRLRNGGESNQDTAANGGAENRNLILWEVLKTTMERHHFDYFSMVQLMINMKKVERDFHDYQLTGNDGSVLGTIETELSHVAITRDADGKMHRDILQRNVVNTGGKHIDEMLKQAYNDSGIEGENQLDTDDYTSQLTTKQFREGIEQGIPLFIAYEAFLVRVDATEGYKLDITDSRQGAHHTRGNPLSTANVICHENDDGTFKFTIIDPDVFNDKGWESKFSALDVFKGSKGHMSMRDRALISAKTAGINIARYLVKAYQDGYVYECLGKGESSLLGKLRNAEEKLNNMYQALEDRGYIEALERQNEYINRVTSRESIQRQAEKIGQDSMEGLSNIPQDLLTMGRSVMKFFRTQLKKYTKSDT